MTKRIIAAAVALAFLAAGCGDDGASPIGPGGAGAPTPDDLGETTSEILENLADGSLDPGDLDDLMENAQDLAESFGASGSGTVSINGDTIAFTSELCFGGQGDFTIDGPGVTSDGSAVWVSIDHSQDSRAEMAEFMDEELITTVYGDADPIVDSNISLDYGRTELFGGSIDGQPSFNASAGTLGQEDMAISIDGQTASGSGSATDFNGVVGDFDDRFDFTFSAGCS